ncbi:MAG: AraC family transcriptional regulator [Pseudomonadota bacterium]
MYAKDRRLYVGRTMVIGEFDCPVSAVDFTDTGAVGGYLLAFPRTAVGIRHADCPDTLVADTNVGTIYNDGQEYQRYRISDYGDRCDWMSFGADSVAEVLHDVGQRHRGDPARLFDVRAGMSSPEVYLAMRRLVSTLAAARRCNPLAAEEQALTILRNVVAAAYARVPTSESTARPATVRRHAALARRAQRVLADIYVERVSLEALAATLDVSAYHLCRVFRRETGSSIYAYVGQLRLREGLAALATPGADLAQISVELGFADHSHFTRRFRSSFRATPSAIRAQLRARA